MGSADKQKRRQFFEDCVGHGTADADGGRVYYFNLEEVPNDIVAIYGLSTDSDIWKRWWAEYLFEKYAALRIFNGHLNAPTDTVMEKIGLGTEYAGIIDRWRELGPNERRVYCLRVEQIGDPATVKSTWYDDIPEFDEWAASCLLEDRTNEEVDSLSLRTTHINKTLSAALTSADADTNAREAMSILRCTRDAIVARLAEESPDDLYVVGLGEAIPVDEVAVEIAKITLALVAQRERRLEKHVDALMAIIKASFNASVVDFLLLRQRGRVEELELLGTTAEMNDAQHYMLEQEASYAQPVGITGAVLVAQPQHEMFHVGTNTLADDPRQSPLHRSAYEGLYGQLENFWVFPVHLRGNLLGALRVVNRLGADGSSVVPWSFLMRRRLVGLMKFVGVLWQACDIEIPLDGLEAPPQLLGESVRKDAERLLLSAEAITVSNGATMAGETLASVLAGLAALSEIRIENRGLEATALIARPDSLDAVAEEIPTGTLERLESLPSLSELDAASTNDGNVLVIRTDGRLAGRVGARSREQLDIERIADHLEAEFALRIPPDDQRLIEIRSRGRHIADYAFAVRSGIWKIRNFVEGAGEIVRMTNLDARLVQDVLQRVVRLSYGHGGIVVISDGRRVPREFPERGERQQISLADISASTFRKHASKDGACVVSSSGILAWTKVYCPNSPAAFSSPEEAKRFRATKLRLQQSLRGTRHEGALCASTYLTDAVVLCASENRTVCAFMNGGAILWDH